MLLNLFTNLPAELPVEAPSSWMVYFHVSDVSAAAAATLANGGAVLKQPTDVGSMTFAVLADPGGATFAVLRERT